MNEMKKKQINKKTVDYHFGSNNIATIVFCSFYRFRQTAR